MHGNPQSQINPHMTEQQWVGHAAASRVRLVSRVSASRVTAAHWPEPQGPEVFPASSRGGGVSRVAGSGRSRESLFSDQPAAVLDVDLCLRLMLSASFQLFVSTSQMQN